MSRSLRAHLLLFAVVAAWGASFVLVKNAFRDISPMLFNFLRMAIAFLVLAILYRREWRSMRRRTLAAGAMVGLFLFLGYEFQSAGLRLTTPSKSAFLTGLTVVLVPMLAVVPALRRSDAPAPRWNTWMGALLAFAGIVLLTTQPALPAAGSAFTFIDLGSFSLGDGLTLGCSLAFALHIIAQDRILEAFPSPQGAEEAAIPFQQLAVLQVGFSALAMGIAEPFLEKPRFHPSPTAVLAVAVASILCTAAAFTIQSWVQQFLPPTHLALIYAFEPVFAWFTSLLFLGQGMGARAALGALSILAGIAAAQSFRGLRTTSPEGIPSL